MAKAAKMDPLEAAKITDARMTADDARLANETPAPKPVPLRTDGPTIEDWILVGNAAEDYPALGFAETMSAGLTRFKATGRIDDDLMAASRRAREPQAAIERTVYVVLEEKRVNVGGGQFSTFKIGHELQLDGYGELGIKNLADQGLKLKLEKRKA